MDDRIEAKVAQILTARELVLNKGSEDGVAEGMRFAILNRKGADILDPDTGESLGSVELPKTFVKVVSTKPKLAVARTFRTFRTSGGPLWNMLQSSGLTNPPTSRVETLKTDEKRLQEELDEDE